MRIIGDLIERRVFRYVVAYGATAWAVLEVVDQLADNGLLPASAYTVVLTLVASGFPGALIVSWFHGAKGRQEVPVSERWMLAAVVVFALGTTGFVARSLGAEGNSSAAPAPWEDPARVAVLYMDARGGPDAEFLAAGLTETLVDQLSDVTGLHVVSRNGSQLFRDVKAPADSVGRALEVGSLVEGTVSLAGDRVRVEVVLTSAAGGDQIASRRLERERSDIFTLQDELADTVAVFLRRAIGREVVARRLRTGTSSTRAWELLQQAGEAEHGASTLVAANDLNAAARLLVTADSLLGAAALEDPAWLQPVVRRGWVAYAQSRLAGMDRTDIDDWISRGLEYADRAVSTNPNDASALELRATLNYWRYLMNLAGTPAESNQRLHNAERDFRAAISAAAGRLPSAQNSLSHLLLNKGEIAEAKLNALQAYTLDPFLENAHLTLWRIFNASWSLQDAVEAERYCMEGVRRFPDNFRFFQCRLMLGALPGASVDVPEAWRLLDAFAEASPPQVRDVNRKVGMMYISTALARAGMADSARAVAMTARAGADLDPLRQLPYIESLTWIALGNREQALQQLRLFLSANPQAIGGLRTDAEHNTLPWYFQPLLDEPAFRSLVGLR